jgi:hypothetical protein
MAAGPAHTRTLWRWRVWSVIGHSMVMGGMIFASNLFRSGSPAWVISAAVAVAGIAVSWVAAIRLLRAEKLVAADRAASPPNPKRWRVTEIGRDGD